MRLLLDTDTFLWSTSQPDKLCERARAAIENPENEVFVSAAVAWEMSLMYALGKLEIPCDPATYFPARLAALGFKALAISDTQALATGALPNHHRDPFDRVMIAQALVESLVLVTGDANVLRYAVNTMDVRDRV